MNFGVTDMFWRKSTIVTVDVLALMVGILIATPFLLVFLAPFVGAPFGAP
jgi:hypothetical protein